MYILLHRIQQEFQQEIYNILRHLQNSLVFFSYFTNTSVKYAIKTVCINY